MSAIPVPRSSPQELKNVLTYERRSLLPAPAGPARNAKTHRWWTWSIVLVVIVICVVIAAIALL